MYVLRVMGSPRLETPSGSLKLERRTAAALTYLALEGETHKYRLAGMLWSESGETAAKGNMRQLLRRLRLAAGDLLEGEEVIRLRDTVSCDAAQLSALDLERILALNVEAELLQGLEFDDAPDFAEWLYAMREELRQLRLRAMEVGAEKLEAEGEYLQALDLALAALRLEPLSETSHRRAMRLHYLLGDRAAALAAFARCQQIFKAELGAEPLAETLQLAQEIERGSKLPRVPTPFKSVPLAMLHPPLLAGREAQWAQMEEAWSAGKLIFLSGDPGVGKSRLAADFLASKGGYVHLVGRPGDAVVPQSCNLRFLRVLLERYTDYVPPRWVRQALAPWMPELGAVAREAAGAPSRYTAATLEVFQQVGLRGDGMLLDDLQFMDEPSAMLGFALLAQTAPVGKAGHLRGYVACFRRNEITAETRAGLRQVVDAGLGVEISVEPLSPEAVELLLEGTHLGELRALAPRLSRYTGGNPLFVLETVRHLHQTGQLENGWPGRLPLTGKVRELTERRLKQLSPAALALAQAAAVLRSDFSFELLAQTVGRPPFELVEAWGELEAAQVMAGERFSHDLVFEAVESGTPEGVRRWLNRSAAELLAVRSTSPARVARHWLEGGEPEKAAQWLLKAADAAHTLGLFSDAVKLYEQVLRVAPDGPTHLQAQVGLTYPLVGLGRLAQAEGLVEALLSQTAEPRLRVKALDSLQTMLMWQGRHTEAEAAINQALEIAGSLGDDGLVDELRFSHGYILTRLGQSREALEVLEPLLPRYRERPMGFEQLHLLSVLGVTYGSLGRYTEAKTLLRESLEGAKQIGSHTNQILAASDLQLTLTDEGRPEDGFVDAEEALQLGNYLASELLRSNLAYAYLQAGRSADARSHLEWLTEHSQDPNLVCLAWARLARVRATLGLEHREALAEALRRLDGAQIPSAHLAVTGMALEHGDAAQRAWAKVALVEIDPAILSPHQQSEYERLRDLAENPTGRF